MVQRAIACGRYFMTKPTISIVLGTLNRYKFLKLTIKSIREELRRFGLPTEIIVIDGGSTDKTIPWLTKQKDIISIIQHNKGTWKNKPITRRSWGYFMNLGFKCTQGKYVCMLSDDCLLVPNAIINGYNFFEATLAQGKKIGALAFYWRNIPFHYYNWTNQTKYNVLCNFGKTYVNHGMYLKKALEDVNYIDEDTYFFYTADTDLCLRMLEKGYECYEAPDSYVEHYFHATMKQKQKNSIPQDEIVFHEKWCPLFNWPKNKSSFSTKEKEFTDTTQTIKQFTRAHFTNFEFWTFLVKDIAKRRAQRYLYTIKQLFTKTTSNSK